MFDVWTQYDTPMNKTYLSTIADKPIPGRMEYGTYGIDFMLGTYSEEEIAESVFSLPSYCEKDYPNTSFCANFKKGSNGVKYSNLFVAPMIKSRERV